MPVQPGHGYATAHSQPIMSSTLKYKCLECLLNCICTYKLNLPNHKMSPATPRVVVIITNSSRNIDTPCSVQVMMGLLTNSLL